jgi:primase-polymerase (primpol)-like protein
MEASPHPANGKANLQPDGAVLSAPFEVGLGSVRTDENGIPDYRSSSGPDLSNIIVELQSWPNWVGWRWTTVKKKDGTVRKTKPLYRIADPGRLASSTNPATWATYAEARQQASQFNGIGLSIEGTPYCGFDFDHCRNKETGEIHPRFRRYIYKLNSYTEVTPSGEGVRVWVKARLPKSADHEFEFTDETRVEAYDSGRYFTVTGDHLHGTPHDIREVDISPIYQEIAEQWRQDEAAEEERLKGLAQQTSPELFAAAKGKKLNVEVSSGGTPSRSSAPSIGTIPSFTKFHATAPTLAMTGVTAEPS